MKIENTTLELWRVLAKNRGFKLKCSTKTKITRSTIDKVLKDGEMNIGTFTVLSKYFNQQLNKQGKKVLTDDNN